ncbi:hypothetical protein BDZ91DRAFT_717275 [Kalaharituber pfeilii]|nr:hypothetical protein BDZ91DRAFT_717275 [Kalaharituber pfeilii]
MAQQPDFQTLRTSMTNVANGFRNTAVEIETAATEIDKIQHMAAANIIRQLERMQQQMTRMEENLLNVLRQLSRSENNNIARIFNSRVAHDTYQLAPLYDINNEVIENFPQTSNDIKELNAEGVNTLLRALGLPVNGRLDAKRERLRRYIGVMTV